MNYRNKLYSKYVSSYTAEAYSRENLESIKKQFSVWTTYFGRFLPKDKNLKIVDLGCGSGGFVWWLGGLGYKNAIGVDISEEQVGLAQELGINVLKEDIRNYLSDKQEEFAIIFGRDIFEHFTKDEVLGVLDLIYQALKNKGSVVIQTANAENLLWGRLRHGDFTHELSFTERSIRQLFLASGFKEVKVYPQPPVVHGSKSLIRFFLWNIFELLIKFYLLVETGSAKGIFTQNIIAVGIKKA